MKNPMLRYANFIIITLFVLLVAGCFDSEPKERKAYNDFLTTHAIPAKGGFVVYPSINDNEAMGR